MTATETAMRALKAALTGIAHLPAPERNIALDMIFQQFEQASGAALILRDGEGQIVNTMLGGDGPGETRLYEIEHRAIIEWHVSENDEAKRETQFDLGVEAIGAAIAASPTLGNVVSAARIDRAPQRDIDIAGARIVKSISIEVTMLFSSSQPF